MSNTSFTYSFPVLQTNTLSFEELNKGWKDDKRYPETSVQKFLLRNSKIFSFLEIDAYGEYAGNGKYVLIINTSKYVGCVPMLSPKTGLPCGNLIVTGRFGENISELLSVIDGYINPEFNDLYKLTTNSQKPPLYFECQNYIDHYITAKKYKWRKFDNIEKLESKPNNSTRWDKYAIDSYDPKNLLRYPNRCNILTKNHKEWEELNYVLDISIQEILSTRTPVRSRMAYLDKVSKLANTYDRNSLPVVSEIKLHMSDPLVIKELKIIANRVLNNSTSSLYAWRIDFAEFFERYVQFLFKTIARSKGARITCNPHFPISGHRPGWALHYLEPDIIIDKSETQYIIDAKYKAHMYQINGTGDKLKDSFRDDFHQVLAYSSFGGAKKKNVMLIYPSDIFNARELDVFSGINGYSSKAYLVGIPLKTQDLEETKKHLADIISI